MQNAAEDDCYLLQFSMTSRDSGAIMRLLVIQHTFPRKRGTSFLLDQFSGWLHADAELFIYAQNCCLKDLS